MIREQRYTMEEMAPIWQQAFQRNQIKLDKGIKEIRRKHSGLPDCELARRWVTCEYCLMKYFGLPWNPDYVPDGNYTRPHFFLENTSWQGRMPTYHDPWMKFDAPEYVVSDMFALCSEPHLLLVLIHGCASRTRILKEHSIKRIDGKNCMVIDSSQVIDIDQWREEACWNFLV